MTHYLTVEIPVPDEATHIAQDADGEWRFFKDAPKAAMDGWTASYWGYEIGTAYYDDAPIDWRDQCYEIERK